MAQPASSSGSVGKIGLIIALFALAIFFWFYLGDDDGGYVDKDFFYDQSEKQLFTALRTSVPPIAGINDATEDAVRAVVISVTANPKDKSSHQIAYLEMYTPEMKRQFEEAQRTGNAPPMGRGAAQRHRLVRRHNEEKWHPIISPEGEKIVSEWAKPGSDGVVPVVCTP